MTAVSKQTTSNRDNGLLTLFKSTGYGVPVAFIVTLLACMTLQFVLPELGFPHFLRLLNPIALTSIAFGITGLYGYIHYIIFLKKHPLLLMLGYLLTHDIVIFILKQLESNLHIALKVNTLLSLFYLVPILLIAVLTVTTKKNRFQLTRIPVLNYLAVFWGVMILYYLLYNHQAVDLRSIIAGEYTRIDWGRLYQFSQVILICFSFNALLQNLKEPVRFFNIFGQYFILLYFGYSLFALILSPAHILTMVIEGFERMALIFGHPNTFAYYMAIAICFTTGFAFYNLNSGKRRAALLTFGTIPIMLLSQMTAGSKTSLFTSLLSVMLVIFLEMIVNKGYKVFLNLKWFATTTGALILTVAFILSSGSLETIQSRLGDNRSMEWRQKQWSRVIENIHPENIVFGHGHTAALVVVQRYVYNVWNIKNDVQESPYIHNDYLEQFYDYGVFIFIWILGLVHLLSTHVKAFFSPLFSKAQRSLHISSFALMSMMILSLFVEPAFYHLPVWLLLVLLYFRATTTTQEETHQEGNAS